MKTPNKFPCIVHYSSKSGETFGEYIVICTVPQSVEDYMEPGYEISNWQPVEDTLAITGMPTDRALRPES